ncbi:ubiquinone/menaquinone biosynthesis C-methylase UbiE [Alkalibacillus flavidus]|uniref:Ubiquinone/menaquinone biosynthesis C-methylase UbiE n=1 Tax=Alkalibacillus flavidus TaxID=546021 RepID=A0ABV2KWD3_9BACI
MDQTTWHEQAKYQWNERASFWHSRSRSMWEEGSRQTIIPFFKQFVPSDSQVLDLGCGDGYGTYKLWQNGYDVTGVDLSDDMIKLCEERLTEDMATVQFREADMTQLPFEMSSFDSVMAINSLEWTAQPAETFREVGRVVRSGGYLLFGILGPTAGPRMNSFERLYGKDVIMNTMMPWEFEQMAEREGYHIIGSEGIYKEAVQSSILGQLPDSLKQSLSFMWLTMLKKE